MVKILLADDAAFMRMRMARLLKGEGHDVVEAENGREAVEQYLAESPDAVFLDVTMPEMDGIEALREIRALDPEAKISMLTAMTQKQIVMEALKLGVKDFVVKPFEKDRVLAALAKMTA